MGFEVQTHRGETFDSDEVMQRLLKPEQRSQIALATDMDYTMFDNDLGVLVFLEKLSDPSFWEFSKEEFSKLLLPKDYRDLIESGARGEFTGLPPTICRLTLDLFQDIGNLYDLQRRIKSGEGVDYETQVVNEFARKMLEFDNIFLILDPILAEHFEGNLLSRTRFFAGKDPTKIRDMTRTVMQRGGSDIGRVIELKIHPELKEPAHQIVSEERISDTYGRESQFKSVDRLVVPILKVRDVVRQLISEQQIPGVIITANLWGIANQVIKHSPDFKFMTEQPYLAENNEELVIGSRLAEKEGKLATRLQGKPVFGPRKRLEAIHFAKRLNRKFTVAIGDSPTTDGPMMQTALRQGGVAVVVGKTYEETRKKFDRVIQQVADSQNGQAVKVEDRAFYISK